MTKIRRTLGLSIVLALAACGALAGQASAASEPAPLGQVSNTGSLSGVTSVATLTSGGVTYAYAASYWTGELNVIDISNPTNPLPSPLYTTPPQASMVAATNVTISGSDLFVTSKNQNTCTPGPPPACTANTNDDGNGNSLTIWSLSNPALPALVGNTPDSPMLFGADSVAVSGNDAYVASQGVINGQPTTPDTSQGSLSVIDLSAPTAIAQNIDNSALQPTAEAGGLNHATSVAVSGNYAYVTAWGGDALTAFNIANTTSPPIPEWTYKDTTNLVNPNDVAVQGNFAYVVNQVSGGLMQLTIFQLNSNPALPPTEVATLTDNAVLGGAYRIRVQGDFAYVSGNAVSSIAAIDISNPAAPRVAGSISSSHLSNVDGLSIAGGGRYLVTTAPLLSSESAPAYPPYPGQAGGGTDTGTVTVIDLEPAPMQVSLAGASEPANPTSQTSANFSFDTGDTVAAVQCSLDGATPGPCSSPTSASYSSLSPGAHTFQVTATYSTGATSQASYAWTINKSSTPPPPGSSAPKVTKAPNISGTAQQGKTLTASTGTWSGSPAPTFRYKWERCTSKGCTAISNQTGRTYRVTAADVGDRLEVVVTASNVAGSASSSFTASNAVKWSAASFATANLTGAKSAHPGVSLSVPSPGSNLTLKQLVIALPTGISPATLHRLRAGASVRDLKGKRLAFTAKLSHGKLTLIFKKPPTGVKVKIASGLVTISAALHRKLKTSKPSEKLSLTLNYSGKPARRGTIKLRLS